MPTLTNTQLHKLIKPVLPFASKDTTLPILCAVHLTAVDGKLAAMATDRYRLGRIRLPEVDAEDFTATLSVKAIRHILATFKATAKGGSVSLSVSEAGEVVVEGHTGAEWGTVRLDIPQPTSGDYKYPNLASLFEGAEERATVAQTAVNGHYLADMGAVVAHSGPMNAPITFKLSQESQVQPILFTHEGDGIEFTGLLQPVRFPSKSRGI